MYNRYIPQPDGSFRRSRVPETDEIPALPSLPDPPEIIREPRLEANLAPPAPPAANPVRNSPRKQREIPGYRYGQRQIRSGPQRENSTGSISGFLSQILPQNFETEDLLVIILLLLMSTRNDDNQNTALLTLAVYLFL